MFNTKQYIVMMLAFQIHHEGVYFVNPTLRQIKEALKFYTGIDVTRRQIRNILHDLEVEGIIAREFHFLHVGPLVNQGQASSYQVVDFNKAFQDVFTLIESSKGALAREKRRLKIREVKKRVSVLR